MQDGPRGDWSTDMQRYRFTQDYRSGIGAWQSGDEYDFDPEMAAFIERDSPGTIEIVPGKLVFVPDGDDDDKSESDEEASDEEASEEEASDEEASEEEASEEEEDESTRALDGPPHNRQVASARKRGA